MNIGYYVTVIRGKRTGWLAGPYSRHDDAKAAVETVRREACRIDPWCDFDAFGTARLESTDPLPLGKIVALKNDLFGPNTR